MRKILSAAVAGAALLAAGQASANTATTTFAVTATVLKACSVNATAIAFGNYTPGGGAINVNTSAVNVNCTKNTTYTVALNGGSTTGGTVAQRLMGNGANTLQYNIYTAATDTTVFGDGSGTSATGAGTGAGMSAAATAFTMYANLPDNPTNQNAAPGAYTDTVTVTVTY